MQKWERMRMNDLKVQPRFFKQMNNNLFVTVIYCLKWSSLIKLNQSSLTWGVEKAGLLAVVGHFLFAVIRLADGSQQLLLLRRVKEVDHELVPTWRRSDSGQLGVVVLDHHPRVLLCRHNIYFIIYSCSFYRKYGRKSHTSTFFNRHGVKFWLMCQQHKNFL